MKKIFIVFSLIFVAFLSMLVVSADKSYTDEIKDFFNVCKKISSKEEKEVILTVDGVPVYQENIDFIIAGKELSKKNMIKFIEEHPEAKELYDETIYKIDTDAIIKEQIRNIVVLNEAKRLGLEVSDKEAKEYEEKMFKLLEEDNSIEQKEFLSEYMKVMDLSETEYRKMTVNTYKNMLTRSKLYENFIEGKTGSDAELEAQYEKYVNKLIKKAKIKYK